MSERFVEQVGQLERRSVVRTARQPANVVFPLVFPLLLLAVNSTGLQSATHLPGFPTDSYLAFALAVVLLHGSGLLLVSAGRVQEVRLGFRTDGTLSARINIPDATLRNRTARELIRRVHAENQYG